MPTRPTIVRSRSAQSRSLNNLKLIQCFKQQTSCSQSPERPIVRTGFSGWEVEAGYVLGAPSRRHSILSGHLDPTLWLQQPEKFFSQCTLYTSGAGSNPTNKPKWCPICPNSSPPLTSNQRSHLLSNAIVHGHDEMMMVHGRRKLRLVTLNMEKGHDTRSTSHLNLS